MRVGLALGGGSVRGLAHLGLLKVFTSEGIPISAVAGTSSGAVVGAVFAAGCDLERAERLALRLSWRHLADFTLSGGGFVRGDRFMAVLKELLQDKRLEEMPVPIAITAVDLATGELVVFREGPAIRAIRASISLPGVFVPVKDGERLLVDGGVLNNVPADVARSMGADVVIAVDVSGDGLDAGQIAGRGPLTRGNLLRWSLHVMKNTLTQRCLSGADLVVRPAVHDVWPFDFRQARRCIEAGEAAARQALPAVRALLERAKEGAATPGQGRPQWTLATSSSARS